MSPINAQSIQEIATAFKNNNPDFISRQFDNNVEITADNKNSAFTKSQATDFLNNFFSDKKVNNLKILHSGKNSGSAYLIGDLSTTKGNYRITLYTKDKNGKPVLQEIRLEK